MPTPSPGFLLHMQIPSLTSLVSKSHEFPNKNEELCIKNEEFCIENEEFCIQND